METPLFRIIFVLCGIALYCTVIMACSYFFDDPDDDDLMEIKIKKSDVERGQIESQSSKTQLLPPL